MCSQRPARDRWWPQEFVTPGQLRGTVATVTPSPAIPAGKDAFAQLRRCAGGPARLTDAAYPGRLMEGAGCLTARASCWPPRRLSAGALLTPQGDHLPHAYDQNDQVGPKAAEDQPSCRGINVPVRGQEQRIRPYACIHRGCRCDHPAGPEEVAARPVPGRVRAALPWSTWQGCRR